MTTCTCSHCGDEHEKSHIPICEVSGCRDFAKYEGFSRRYDLFSGKPICLVFMRVCEYHRTYLINEFEPVTE